MKPHKWAKEIKAWADGAEIEKWVLNDTWQRVGHPDWYEFENYRIKPQPKEPQYLYVMQNIDDKSVHLFTQKYETVYYHYIGKIKLEQDDD